MRRKTVRRAPVRRAPVRRRKARVSGINTSNVLMQVVGLAGGSILARVANNLILKAKPDLNSKLISIAQIGLGVYLPTLVKSDLGKNLGAGMVASGGLGLVTSFGIINGIDEISGTDDEIMEVMVSGTDDLEVISGMEDDFSFDSVGELDVINGMEDDY